MTTYTVVAGDTFELIARKVYGTEAEASRLSRANSGVSEPLAPGTVLAVPDMPGALKDQPISAPADSANEVAVLINGKRFRFWDRISIKRSMDSMDSISLGSPFDHSAPGFKEAFRPFAYRPLTVTIGGTPLFTGTLVSAPPVVDRERRALTISGYSKPGVLNDCTMPASAFPLEFNNQGLKKIATSIAEVFGLSVDFRGSQGATFEQVECEAGRKALDFLVGLAKQRNLVIASTERGALLFWQSVETGSPVARLAQGSAPVLSVTPTFSAQEYYSDITGLDTAAPGSPGSQYTVKNPHLKGVVRPFVFATGDNESGGIKDAVQAKAGRMLGGTVSYAVRVATWRDSRGQLWAPNTTVKLIAPDALVYSEYEFLIRSAQLERDRGSEVAALDLVLPGAFSGKIPETMPWD